MIVAMMIMVLMMDKLVMKLHLCFANNNPEKASQRRSDNDYGGNDENCNCLNLDFWD